ncbi:MAG TPA: phosphoglycerate kinase [Rhizomicrobium sp.]|jgi:phosphoglycerate kinase|nr:phosphoglycerate kinase [Rhizomicrobium sp.]
MSERNYRTLDDLAVSGRRVLVRADLNVPMRDGKVTDTLRIERQAPTIRELANKGARVVVLSHFGRPKGKPVASMSLEPVVSALSVALGCPVSFAGDCIGPKAEEAVALLGDGEVLLLENTRFYAGEENNDPTFAKAVAMLGDNFVNDAFSAAHRAHATTEALAHLLPSAAGRAMEAELAHLHRALDHPERPVMAVVGGAKISTKLELLGNLIRKVDVLVIGGAMANTFLAAQGLEIGKSLSESDHLDTARNILRSANAQGAALVLPVDVVVAREFKPHAECRVVGVNNVAPGDMILDVGPETIEGFLTRLEQVRTLVWNGPFGAFETQPFDRGTAAAAKHAAERTKAGKLLSVAGGGDTVAALNVAGVADEFSYVSTAGGAFLEWMEGRELPGVVALKQNRGTNNE